MNHFESSVINLIWTKKLVLLYINEFLPFVLDDLFDNRRLEKLWDVENGWQNDDWS